MLSEIIPRQNRRSKIKELEDYLGFDLNILRPPRWITRTLINACCHGWSIGSFTVKSDTVYFGTKPGYMKDWNYFSAEIENDGLRVFLQEQGNKINSVETHYIKNEKRTVLKIIKI